MNINYRKLNKTYQELQDDILRRKGEREGDEDDKSSSNDDQSYSFNSQQSTEQKKEPAVELDEENFNPDCDLVFETRASNRLYSQLVISEFCSLFFSMLGLFLQVLKYEMNVGTIKGETQVKIFTIPKLSIVCTILLVASIYIRYNLWLKWQVSMQKYTGWDNLINTGLWRTLLFEVLINIVAPLPIFDGLIYSEYVDAYDVTIKYEFNDILLFFMFNRLYLAFKFSLYMTQFLQPRSQRVCAMYGCEASIMFAIKSSMKQKPYLMLFLSLGVTTIIFGYQLRLFESELNEASGQDFSDMYNCMWNVIITLTSVGYGEIFPKTSFGRFIGIVICFWGVFIISFFVVTVTNVITFSNNEEKAHSLLMNLIHKKELKKAAVGVLQSAYKHRNITRDIKKKKTPRREVLGYLQDFRSQMLQFSQKAFVIRQMRTTDEGVTIMQNTIEKLIEQVESLRENQDQTYHNIKGVYDYMKSKRNQQRHSDNITYEDSSDESRSYYSSSSASSTIKSSHTEGDQQFKNKKSPPQSQNQPTKNSKGSLGGSMIAKSEGYPDIQSQ